MGNNNSNASLTEQHTSKVENNGKSPLESGSVETTQDQVFLASEGKDGDGNKEKESLPDGKIGEATPETEPQKSGLVEEPKVKNVQEEVHQSGLESLVKETDAQQLQKHKSVEEGVETMVMKTEVEVNTTEIGNEEKRPSAIDEIASIDKTDGPEEEKVINESLEQVVPGNEVSKLVHETGLEQRAKVPDPQEILIPEEKADKVIPKPFSQESNAIKETGLGFYNEEKAAETGREDSQAQQIVPEVPFPSSNEKGLEKPNTSKTLLVSCLESNKAQEPTEAVIETNKEARLEIRSPSFGNDLKVKERSDESTDKTPLVLCEDKSETYEATIGVEEKTVMLKTSESEKERGFELSLGLSMIPRDRSETDGSFKETKDSEDNLLDKKGSIKGRLRKRSKSFKLGTCLGCA